MALGAGWLLIVLGIAGLFLPFLQGFFLIGLGLYLLSRHLSWLQRFVLMLKVKYPHIASLFDRLDKYISNGKFRRSIIFSPPVFSFGLFFLFWLVFFFPIVVKNDIFLFGNFRPYALPSQSFYPFTFLFHNFFSPEYATSFLLVSHVLLAGFCMYLYAKKIGLEDTSALICSMSFSYGAFFITRIINPPVVFSAAWLPLGLYVLETYCQKRQELFFLWLPPVILLQIFAGSKLIALFSLGIYISYFCWFWIKEKMKPLALFWFLFFVLCGGLAASIEIIPHGGFAQYFRWPVPGAATFPFSQTVTYIFPNFFGWERPAVDNNFYFGIGHYWEVACYVGLLPFILALVSMLFGRLKHITYFTLLFLSALLLSLGRYHFGLDGFIFLQAVSLAVLAGFGLKAILLRRGTFTFILKKIYSGVGIFFLLLFSSGYSFILLGKERLTRLALGWVGEKYSPVVGIWADRLVGGLQYSLNIFHVHFYFQLFVLFIIYWILKGFKDGEIKPKIVYPVLIFILAADLYYFGGRYNITVVRTAVFPLSVVNTVKPDPNSLIVGAALSVLAFFLFLGGGVFIYRKQRRRF